ncbi:MAG: hypothetical protein H7A45_09325 [Verrucomicrobiales bacterium]|nr:hypothetical protein [Verrucomicrobiales bacterium]MCP5526209.1 hypothetical protein [Verrucomicrobiales bacterium]
MELRIGSPATGGNFFHRHKLIARLLRALKRDNVAFLGPRRTGKTSCLEHIKKHPGEFVPVLLNLEKHDSVEAWLRATIQEVRHTLGKPLSRINSVNGPRMGTDATDGVRRCCFGGEGGKIH